MAGTVTSTPSFAQDRSVNRISVAWVSDASGNATADTPFISGVILCVEFKPDGGATQPSDAYDITLSSTSGVNVLAGQGANLSNVTATAVVPGVPFKDGTTTSTTHRAVAETLALSVSNAGDSKGGTVVLYVR
jgi:hypothetical protein